MAGVAPCGRQTARRQARRDARSAHHRHPRPRPPRVPRRHGTGAVRRRPSPLRRAVRAGQALAPGRRPDELDGQVAGRLSRRSSSRRAAPISPASTATTTSTCASATPGRWPATARRPRSRPSSARCPRGITHMLPTEDAAWVGEELQRRFGPQLLAVRDDRDGRQPVLDPARPPDHRSAAHRRPRLQLPRQRRRDVRLADRRRTGRGAPGQHRAAGRPGAHHPGRPVQRHRRARGGPGRPPGRGPPHRAGPDERRASSCPSRATTTPSARSPAGRARS